MKITLPSFLLLFILTSAINAQQKIGFKIILDQNLKYSENVQFYNTGLPSTWYGNYSNYYSVITHKRSSMSYGLTYEKAISNKFLTSIETGLYLNTQSSSGISSDRGESALNYKDYFSDNELHTFTLERKITELHIPILIKKYFYIKSALFFVSAGPKLALTLSDKTSYEDVNNNSILMKRNNFDTSFVHSSRFYLINPLNINLGFEYKKVQISTSYALFNIKNLHSENAERSYYNNNVVNKVGYNRGGFAFLYSLSIGYTL